MFHSSFNLLVNEKSLSLVIAAGFSRCMGMRMERQRRRQTKEQGSVNPALFALLQFLKEIFIYCFLHLFFQFLKCGGFFLICSGAVQNVVAVILEV